MIQILVVDSNIKRLTETVGILKGHGYTASGETTLPLEKPSEAQVIILCVAARAAITDFIESLHGWQIPLVIWCNQTLSSDQERARCIGELFNRYHHVLLDVFFPIPTLDSHIIGLFEEALVALSSHTETS